MNDDAARDFVSADDDIVERDAAAADADGALGVILSVEGQVLQFQIDRVGKNEESLAIRRHQVDFIGVVGAASDCDRLVEKIVAQVRNS